jgi:DHA1 family multidrug resistance protein-like MFS transporter
VFAVHATWGLSLFVPAYGIGPMFLSPIQDMVQIGRTPVCERTLFEGKTAS